METMRRTERPLPPPLPAPMHTLRERHAEEDFEATIGNLVRYYATLPPGALEESVNEQSAAESGFDGHSTQEVAVTPRRRTWAWVLGGASSMVLGGVVTFALIVGRPDFWRVADRPAATPPKITVAGAVPDKSARGIPKAVPLVDTVEESLAETAAPAVQIVAESAAAEPPVVVKQAVETKAQDTATPARTPRRAATAAAPAKRVKARRIHRSAHPTPSPAAPAPAARGGGDEWEDPYQ